MRILFSAGKLERFDLLGQGINPISCRYANIVSCREIVLPLGLKPAGTEAGTEIYSRRGTTFGNLNKYYKNQLAEFTRPGAYVNDSPQNLPHRCFAAMNQEFPVLLLNII